MKVRLAAAALLVPLLTGAMPGSVAAATTGASTSTRPLATTVEALPSADRRILAELPSSATVGIHARTGRVRFLGGTRRAPLMTVAAVRRTARATGMAVPEAGQALAPVPAARAFLSQSARLFGVRAPGRDLRVARTERLGAQGSVVRFQQTRRGVPVLGGELLVRLDRRGDVLAAAGEALPASAAVQTGHSVRVATARRTAAGYLAREAGVATSSVITASEGLTILDERILGGPEGIGPRLVWSIDARAPMAADGAPAHAQVLVDARTGDVLESIPRIETALYRRICDFKNVGRTDFRCRSGYARVEGDPATGAGQVDDAYRLMGVVDAFYRDRFGRDGLDDAGERMVATVRYCSPGQCPLANSFWEWGPQQVAFGSGWASADDIVGHEFTHGVLDHEARLFYSYQSGALNEGFADIFGEFIDLTYPGGKDTPGTRWLIGEDLPGGAIRDLSEPGRFGYPDRIRSSRYSVGAYDTGGVHINSAVAGKAAALMTDGGTFRGVPVKALGLTKVAAIEYEAMTNLLTSAADYNDLFNALQQACVDLVGTSGITYADCRSVQKAVTVTQMDQRPLAGGPRTATTCPAGTFVRTTYFDDFEDTLASEADWTSHKVRGRDTWYYPQNPNNDPDWDGTWASSGSRNLFGDDPPVVSDATMVLTRDITLPKGARLRFEHGFQFDADSKRAYDGGVVEISVAHGPWKDAGRYMVQSGYTGRITKGTKDPLAGRRAFTGRSRGWGATRLDLSSLAGKSVRIRFRIGTDKSAGSYGWFIDDVRIYRCVTDTQRPTASISLDGGAASSTSGIVDVGIKADGTGSKVTRIRISNSSTTKDGKLKTALALPFRKTIAGWSLRSTAWGGSGGDGSRKVFLQVRDSAGNWSKVASDAITLTSP